MTPRTTTGSAKLGDRLRNRRHELGLTIEEAARAAGVGSETWRRYEAGGSIRRDKVRGICRALRWRALPDHHREDDPAAPKSDDEGWETYPKEKLKDSYSPWLAKEFGDTCARVFAFGCSLVSDHMNEDLSALAQHPRGTHLGELGHSWLVDSLPPQWVMRYDYEFLYRLRTIIDDLRLRAMRPGWDGSYDFTRSVADDLALHLIMEEGAASAEASGANWPSDLVEWELSLNGEDDEVIQALFSATHYIDHPSSFHFDRWFHQTYYGRGEAADAEDANPDTDPER